MDRVGVFTKSSGTAIITVFITVSDNMSGAFFYACTVLLNGKQKKKETTL